MLDFWIMNLLMPILLNILKCGEWAETLFLNCWYFSSRLFLQTFAIFLPHFFLTFRFHLAFELSFPFHHVFSASPSSDPVQAFICCKQDSFHSWPPCFFYIHHTLFISFKMAEARRDVGFLAYSSSHTILHLKALKLNTWLQDGGILVESSILSDLTTFGSSTLT